MFQLLISLPRLMVIVILLTSAIAFLVPALILMAVTRAFIAAGDPNK